MPTMPKTLDATRQDLQMFKTFCRTAPIVARASLWFMPISRAHADFAYSELDMLMLSSYTRVDVCSSLMALPEAEAPPIYFKSAACCHYARRR